MITLRDYQVKTNQMLTEWFHKNPTGHPCVVLPTGSGKSIVIADFCKTALDSWPTTRIVMLTATKELVQQNYNKIKMIWPNAPTGIYCAGLGRKEIDQITFGSIQSLRKKAGLLGHVDIILIDECHNVSHRDQGGYRSLIAELTEINPHLRVIGYSATPFRLGHGLITDGDALFDDLIEPVSIMELIEQGYLAPLRSKLTEHELNASGVKKRGGEYIAKDLQDAINTDEQNRTAVSETIRLAGDRKAWLFFCAGVDHALAIRDILRENGINAETVTGDTPKAERDRILRDFQAGLIQAVTNCGVLTTGFDYPDIDLIAMLRPTESKGLYIQMAGRGMRLKSHADHCLVLDFAGVVARHGPITSVSAESGAKGDSKKEIGDPPSKACQLCNEINPIGVRACVACGELFPEPKPKPLDLHTQHDIMGLSVAEMTVSDWEWSVHTSYNSGKQMAKIKYYGACMSAEPITEYLTLLHDGYAGMKAIKTFDAILKNFDTTAATLAGLDLDAICDMMNQLPPPARLEYLKNGKFYDVKKRIFELDQVLTA